MSRSRPAAALAGARAWARGGSLPRRWIDDLRLRRIERRLAGPRLLRAFADAHPKAFFIEIGSNDGEQHDHLRPHVAAGGWRGVMVEPVPYVFERLSRNYAGVPGVSLERAAIGAAGGSTSFFHLREATPQERRRLPDWYDGIGSFSREHVLAHGELIPDIAERLVSTEVVCLSFEALCEKHGVERIDLLLVDAEGDDARILAQLELERRRPRLIVYEHFHLSETERVACRERLADAGYECFEEGFDTWCLDPSKDRLTELWGRLRPGLPGVYADAAR